MIPLINEEDIQHVGLLPADVNYSWRWYRQLNHIVSAESVHNNVRLTLETREGKRMIDTHIIMVIEHYVKIGKGTIIPLSSIACVHHERPLIVIREHHSPIYILLVALLIVLIMAVLFFFIMPRSPQFDAQYIF